MNGAFARLNRWLEAILSAGLVASAGVLLGGLALGSERTLHAGLVLLVATPVARVLAVTAGFAHARDWLFAALSFGVLAVLAIGTVLGVAAAR
ncbi:MAG TPA: DUF1634 domain-containing protein [Vicinamibacteria bacterium]